MPAAGRQDPHIPARDDVAELADIRRGSAFLDTLTSVGVDIGVGTRVADLGSGFGTLSLACAELGAEVTSVDVNCQRLDVVRGRAAEAGIDLAARQANLLDEPVVQDADVAFLIGVVEYAGLWTDRRDIETNQVRVLHHAYQSLRNGGVLVVGTKNRLWPGFVIRDVHTKQPLINAVPRKVLDAFASWGLGPDYRHYIHSPRHWGKLVRAAGFPDIETYYPLFSYQFPIVLTQKPTISDLRVVSDWVRNPSREIPAGVATGRAWRTKGGLMVAAHFVNAPLSHSLLLVARKR